MLKIDECKEGYLYKIDARNSNYGIFVMSRYGTIIIPEFVISRFKFRDNFTFEEIHVDGSDHFGTALPIKEIEKSPFDLIDFSERPRTKEKEILDYLNKFNRD